jgi:hypothetical protein
MDWIEYFVWVVSKIEAARYRDDKPEALRLLIVMRDTCNDCIGKLEKEISGT